MTLAGKAQFQSASALALTIASELNALADSLVMSTREVYDTEYLMRALDAYLDDLASLSEKYGQQLLKLRTGGM